MARHVIKVGFVTEAEPSRPRDSSNVSPRDPEFIVDGWAYFAINALDSPGPTSTGDAKFSPIGSIEDCAGLVWEVGPDPLVDCEHTAHGLVLYVTIRRPIENWEQLKEQLLALMPAIKAAWNNLQEGSAQRR